MEPTMDGGIAQIWDYTPTLRHDVDITSRSITKMADKLQSTLKDGISIQIPQLTALVSDGFDMRFNHSHTIGLHTQTTKPPEETNLVARGKLFVIKLILLIPQIYRAHDITQKALAIASFLID
jgi:hypothetical protein